MATIHISEADAARDFVSLLAQVRAGADVIIEDGVQPIVMQAALPKPKTLGEVLALLPIKSPAVDDDFAGDVAEARDSMDQPLNTSAWD